jgi:DNA-binding HxlR family transcriptional regulator
MQVKIWNCDSRQSYLHNASDSVYIWRMRKTKIIRSHCPVNFGLEAFGDRWALLILRDIIFRGKRTYGEFLRSEEGFATNILASRLEHLVRTGILQCEGDEKDGRKEIYSLTEKGLDLIPVIFEIVLWSEKHDIRSEAKRIKRLVELIRKDNRKISKKVREQVKRGEAILPEYLK